MNKFERMIDECLYSIKTIINPIFIMVILSVFTIGRSMGYYSWTELALNSFCGPFGIDDNSAIVLQWMCHQIFIFYLIGNYFNHELNERYIYVILRQKSKFKWMFNRIIHILILISFYYLFSFLFVGILGYILPLNAKGDFFKQLMICTGFIEKSHYLIIVHMYLLIVLTTFVLGVFQIVITLFTKNSVLPAIMVNLFILLSIGAASIGEGRNKYFLPNQAILSKHNVSYFNFSYSYCYLLLFFIISLLLCVVCIKREEI